MKTIEEIDAICEKRGFTPVSISDKPTWIDANRTEGIVVNTQAKTVITFWFKQGERVYGEPPSEKTQKTVDMIREAHNESNETKEENKEIEKQNEGSGATTLIPDSVSKKLLEKWKQMTTFDRMIMFQKTAPEYVKQRPKGKKMVSYVEGNVMQLEANIAFLFNWSDRIDGFHFSDNAVACYGSVCCEIDGNIITHSAVGVDLQEFKKETKEPVFTQEELMKNAHTDMIKKALSKFGFNSDVYRGEV